MGDDREFSNSSFSSLPPSLVQAIIAKHNIDIVIFSLLMQANVSAFGMLIRVKFTCSLPTLKKTLLLAV